MRAILGSLVLHAGLAASVIGGGSGHPPPGGPVVMTPADLLDIDTANEAIDVAPTATATATADGRPARAAVRAPPPDHTHPYPVPESHHERPHDPSLSHEHPPAHGVDPLAEAAPAPAPAPAALPVFALADERGAIAAGEVRIAPRDGAGGGHDVHGSSASGGEALATTTYAAHAVSVPARLVASAPAPYPTGARAGDVEGDVGLEIVVDERGQVVDARIVSPGGHGFDASALDAIRRYRFSAAQRGGRAVRVRMPWTVRFRLR